ncbi:MAG: SPOR domain-containing protein [Desertifilum sp. SIO1I2]|nr:SPOR domain-containing protein [Desertifilum sp. SIO1I2]
MSQRSLAALPGQTSQTPPLHSALQSALGSLDVQLEDELIRYRRAKSSDPLPPPRGLERHQPRKPLDLITLSAPPIPEPELAVPETAPPEPEAPAPVEASSSLVLSSPEETPEIQLTETPSPEPEDYLESSEELLKNLNDEPDAELPQRSPWVENLLTPLSLGAMLLLLLVSATLGYALKNPSLFNHLLARRSPDSTDNPLLATPATEASASPTALPQAPNLANQEFKDVNLDTLSSLQRTPSSPSPSPSPVAASPSPPPATVVPRGMDSNPPATTQPPLSSLLLPPTPSPQTPVASSPGAIAPSEPVAVAPVENEGLVYAIANYDGEGSLEQIREVVPDAYLRDFNQGTQIQLGAFSDTASAEAFIEELQTQGISAQIYRP